MEMTTPTLLLGGESPKWAKESTEVVHKAFPNSRIAVLVGQGHVAINTARTLHRRGICVHRRVELTKSRQAKYLINLLYLARNFRKLLESSIGPC